MSTRINKNLVLTAMVFAVAMTFIDHLLRVLQGATAAVMFPAAVAIVVASFPMRERGRAMTIFFGTSGALTAIGRSAVAT